MFKEVIFEKSTNEEEFYGGAIERRITLKALLDWLAKVNASKNAQFLKCYNWTKNAVEINNIDDITFSSNLMHKDVVFDKGVKIAFKEDPSLPAMTLAHATELFNAIAAKCNEDGIDTNDVEVFVQNPNGKLTQFCWFYDDEFDTACIVKNMNPRAVSRFMHGGADAVIVKAAKTANISGKIIDELAKIEEQMQKLQARRDATLKKLEDLPAQA